MESATARIPVRSRRQAMDWSLVLVSQGIESTIDCSEDDAGWGLIVAANDYTPALRTLRQYCLENRAWPWQQTVFPNDFLFDWGCLAWVALLMMFYWPQAHLDLRPVGLMDSAAVAGGQWWRLFTAVWLHADIGHLASNAGLGLVLLGLAMGRHGTGAGLLAAYLAGAGGNIVACILAGGQPHHSLGASGMVMGSLGLLAIQSIEVWRRDRRRTRFILSGFAASIMLFILFGLAPGTDLAAHFGGFVCGAILGGALSLAPSLARRPAINLACGLLFAMLVIVPWWLALRGKQG